MPLEIHSRNVLRMFSHPNPSELRSPSPLHSASPERVPSISSFSSSPGCELLGSPFSEVEHMLQHVHRWGMQLWVACVC